MSMTSVSDEIDNWDIVIGDIATNKLARVRESIVSINVSYSTTLCTQLQIEMIDPNFEMLRANYFIVGRDIIYRSKAYTAVSGIDLSPPDAKGRLIHLFEIASVEVRPSSGTTPSIVIQARTKAVQQMKRDKNPGAIQGTSSDFVYYAALQYGLKPVIQQTDKSKKINQASGDKQADSTWDVLSNLANDAKFMLFETDGMLFFCSMDYLMGRWGVTQMSHNVFTNSRNEPVVSPVNVIPLIWPPLSAKDRDRHFYQTNINYDKEVLKGIKDSKTYGLLIPMEMPTLRRSDNDPFVVSGSVSVDRSAGISMRPGMTLVVGGIPTFEDIYLISDVSFDHYSGQPVSLEFTKPEREGKFIQTYSVGAAFADYSSTTQASSLITSLRVI